MELRSARPGVHFYVTVMMLDDSLHDIQSDARPFPHLFGSEKRVKDA
jgi:hypothetical protein